MTTITLKVDPEQMDKWVVDHLQQTYIHARKCWNNDQPYNDNLCDALLTSLEHYMSISGYEKWYETIKEL